MKKTARQRSTSKGRDIMKMAERVFLARGCLLDKAVAAVTWIPAKVGGVPTGQRRPIAVKHDHFGIWDAVVVEPGRAFAAGRKTFFVQVTTAEHLWNRRKKILDAGFPCTVDDLVMAYLGRGVFRVVRGPGFAVKAAETWRVPTPGALAVAAQRPAFAGDVEGTFDIELDAPALDEANAGW